MLAFRGGGGYSLGGGSGVDLGAVLIATAVLSTEAERRSALGRAVGGPLIAFGFMCLLSNLHLAPVAHAAYEFCWSTILPMSLAVVVMGNPCLARGGATATEGGSNPAQGRGDPTPDRRQGGGGGGGGGPTPDRGALRRVGLAYLLGAAGSVLGAFAGFWAVAATPAALTPASASASATAAAASSTSAAGGFFGLGTAAVFSELSTLPRELAAKVAGALTATYVGGSVNLFAVAAAVGLDGLPPATGNSGTTGAAAAAAGAGGSSVLGALAAADVFLMAVYFAGLFWAHRSPGMQRLFAQKALAPLGPGPGPAPAPGVGAGGDAAQSDGGGDLGSQAGGCKSGIGGSSTGPGEEALRPAGAAPSQGRAAGRGAVVASPQTPPPPLSAMMFPAAAAKPRRLQQPPPVQPQNAWPAPGGSRGSRGGWWSRQLRPWHDSLDRLGGRIMDAARARAHHAGWALLSLSAAFAVCKAGERTSRLAPFPGASTLAIVVGAAAVGWAAAGVAPRAQEGVAGVSTPLAGVLLNAFFAAIGAGGRASEVLSVGPALLLFAGLALAVHALFLVAGALAANAFLGAVAARGPHSAPPGALTHAVYLDDVLVASNANIGGAGTAGAFAALIGRGSLVVPGAVWGTVGNAGATALGIGVWAALR